MFCASYVCPWWAAPFTIATPLRRWLHNPEKIVGPYLTPGMTVMDVGAGVGWFSIPMARMVGESGKVIAVDLQQKMLDMLSGRAEKAGVAGRIELHRCEKNRLAVEAKEAKADFVLVFAMLHEVPDPDRLLGEVRDCLKPGGKLLLAEPPIHVPAKTFENEVVVAEKVGFRVIERPRMRWSRAVVLAKAEA